MMPTVKPFMVTPNFNGYIPQIDCLDEYQAMFLDKDFIGCYGVALEEQQVRETLIKDIKHWEDHHFGPLLWYDAVTHAFVGRIGPKTYPLDNKIEVELGYAISPKYWGKGIAMELSRLTMDYVFDTFKITKMICFTLPHNKQSLRVMEKLGFKYERDFIHAGLMHKLHRMNRNT